MLELPENFSSLSVRFTLLFTPNTQCTRAVFCAASVLAAQVSKLLKLKLLIEAAKTEYFRKKVEDASHDQLFKFVDKFLNVKKAPILPKHESSKD